MGRTSSNPNLRARAPPPLPSPTLKPPDDEEDDSDLGFSTATTPVNAKVSSAMSKRRPSMPSILEKAAHPGQTIRSALSATTQDDGTGAASGVPPAAKGFKSGGSLAAKRSISNFFLRKATTQQAQSSHGGELAAPTLSAGGVSSKSARGLSLASTFSPRKSAGAIKPSPAGTSTSVADPRNVTMATSHHRAPPAPPSPSAKSLSSSSPPSRPRRRAQSLVGALQRRPFASDPAPPLPGAPLSPTSSLSSNGGGGSGGSSALGQVQTSFRDIVWQTSSSSGGTNSGSNSAVAIAPAAACDEEREYLGESSPTHDGQDDDDGGMGDSFLPASLRRREGSTTGPGSSSGGSRNSPRGFRLVKLPSTGTLNSVVLAEGNSPAGGRSRSGTTSNASNSTGSIRSVVGQGTSPRAEMNRQRSSSSLSSMASTPASAAGKASAQLRRPPAETSRNRSNSLASASFLSTSSNSSLRAAFNSASGPPPSSEQARNLLLKHAGEFGAGRGVVGEDGNTLTLAKQLAAYGEALERERGGSSAAGGPGSGLTYKRSREALPSVKEYGRPLAPTERGLVAPAPPSGSAVTRYRSSSDTASTSAAGGRIYGRQSFASSSSNAPAVDGRTSSSAGRGHKQRFHPQQRPIPPDLDRSANSSPNRERSASDSGLLHPPARRGDPVYANTTPSGRPASNSASTGGTDATGVSGSTAPTSVGGYEEARPKMSHVCGADDDGEQEERLQDDGEDSWERVG
ncbi:hypothetical protein BDZ90DRAFT_227158 [Jaminaea rosea]|uniref:Uncharacterized protein n=1 Tax=Jaminaea rosea TaxID=1569628 RepID=A0A316UPX2_9BASI|nr:hypothetical protein BDZ90DRAFT_227158 [Jaminaea rosea]PWN27347.1 hypothetical protein BDZ90DRAFT_227158 [Jaminaea rosea]